MPVAAPAIAVSIRSLSVVRGGRTVLRDVDLELPAGRIVGIIGPSGCGKSTLMRSIVGVQARVSGSIDVLGADAGIASRRGDVGYVTQAPSVYDDVSIRQNLTYFGRLLGVGDPEVKRVLGAVRLGELADRRVQDLSGGQRARVSLAIALLGGPPLLVLDEPTVGLDPVLRQELWGQFADLAASATRCDWLVLLRDGTVLAHGTPADLLARTGTETVEDAFLVLVAEREVE